jgi:hypothetical protein
MAERTDFFSLYAAYLIPPLPHLHEHVIIDPSKPSGIRVFGKSLFMLAAGWGLAVAALAQSAVRPEVFGLSLWPSIHPLDTIALGIVPALLMVLGGWAWGRITGRAPYRELELREWRHAFGWCIVPNTMLLATTWLILNGTSA